MGLYTYDVTLEQIIMPEAGPSPAMSGMESFSRDADSRRSSAKSQVMLRATKSLM